MGNEIFNVAIILFILTLIGLSLGFVLLKLQTEDTAV
uniref:Cytochrome b6-f complex subunit 7 n=2 Tax=Glaucocystis TaxID=38258 RepID=A0A3G1IVI2_9EUKA|nr:cytochrome b6/f complex subunit 7 [Glaucocystis incrassata]ASQ39946.1 cytochrome b6/f complex subunit 7 [Glaucocystis sp. BBH]ASQ40066.1 cytochrome b6/f complex subunit 7 [Glaucocystis incrassata]